MSYRSEPLFDKRNFWGPIRRIQAQLSKYFVEGYVAFAIENLDRLLVGASQGNLAWALEMLDSYKNHLSRLTRRGG